MVILNFFGEKTTFLRAVAPSKPDRRTPAGCAAKPAAAAAGAAAGCDGSQTKKKSKKKWFEKQPNCSQNEFTKKKSSVAAVRWSVAHATAATDVLFL